jgi:cell division protein FtsW
VSSSRDLRPAALIVSAALLLIIWGLLTVFNTSAAEIIDRAQVRSTHSALFKQGLYALVGLGAAASAWWVGVEPLLKRPWWLWASVCFLLALCFVPGLGQAANGASRWIRLGPISLQPSELAKIILPLCAVGWLRQMPDMSFLAFLRLMALLAFPIGLILLEPDNGTTLIAAFTVALILFLAEVKAKYWALPMGILFIGGLAIASQMPHVHRRLEIYLNPEADLKGKGHQPYQARIAVGSGGLTGRGLGQGLQKLEYLPEAQNDYIAAIVAEETGFVGMIGLIGLYSCLLIGGFWVALRLQDWSRVLAATLTALLCLQAFLNLGVVSGVLPSTGINLPLFSQGGTSLLCNLILIGWLMRLSAAPVPASSPAGKTRRREIQKSSRIAFSARYWQEKPKSLA